MRERSTTAYQRQVGRLHTTISFVYATTQRVESVGTCGSRYRVTIQLGAVAAAAAVHPPALHAHDQAN